MGKLMDDYPVIGDTRPIDSKADLGSAVVVDGGPGSPEALGGGLESDDVDSSAGLTGQATSRP